jgi:hypothetical protein
MRDLGASGEERWREGACEASARRPAEGVVVYVFRGRMESTIVPSIERFAQASLATPSSRVDLFFDTEGMSGYHPHFREKMTAWHERFKPNTRASHVLVTSSFVSMAISVVNLLTGGLMTSHSKRATFEASLREACRAASAVTGAASLTSH